MLVGDSAVMVYLVSHGSALREGRRLGKWRDADGPGSCLDPSCGVDWGSRKLGDTGGRRSDYTFMIA